MSAASPFSSSPIPKLRWLVRLRWVALASVLGGLLFALWARFPWVSPGPIALSLGAGVLYNLWFHRRIGRAGPSGARELELHAVADVGALTLLLAASGGVRNPIVMFYGFHVVLGAMLGLLRGAVLAALMALLGIGLLLLGERFHLLFAPPLLSPPLWLGAGAAALTILSLGYFSLGALRFLRREQERAILLERMASLGQALQGVAHELNTPLSTIQTLAVDLSHQAQSADAAESISLIIDEARRCRAITRELLWSARPGEEDGGRRGPTLLRDVVERARKLTCSSAEEMDRIRIGGDLGLSCSTDGDRLLQILVNLLQNARDAAAERPIEVRLRAEDHGVAVEVRDRGPGLPREVRERLFAPFVTTKAPGEGTGLGLYTCARLARQLGAVLSVEDAPDGGGGVLARLLLTERV